jgi:hypothetical protein
MPAGKSARRARMEAYIRLIASVVGPNVDLIVGPNVDLIVGPNVDLIVGPNVDLIVGPNGQCGLDRAN